MKYIVYAEHSSNRKEFSKLSDAKSYGLALAKRNAGKGKWNVFASYVGIYVSPSIGYHVSMYHMYFPVRGTGMKGEKILEIMKKRGIPAFKWIRDKNYEYNMTKHGRN